MLVDALNLMPADHHPRVLVGDAVGGGGVDVAEGAEPHPLAAGQAPGRQQLAEALADGVAARFAVVEGVAVDGAEQALVIFLDPLDVGLQQFPGFLPQGGEAGHGGLAPQGVDQHDLPVNAEVAPAQVADVHRVHAAVEAQQHPEPPAAGGLVQDDRELGRGEGAFAVLLAVQVGLGADLRLARAHEHLAVAGQLDQVLALGAGPAEHRADHLHLVAEPHLAQPRPRPHHLAEALRGEALDRSGGPEDGEDVVDHPAVLLPGVILQAGVLGVDPVLAGRVVEAGDLVERPGLAAEGHGQHPRRAALQEGEQLLAGLVFRAAGPAKIVELAVNPLHPARGGVGRQGQRGAFGHGISSRESITRSITTAPVARQAGAGESAIPHSNHRIATHRPSAAKNKSGRRLGEPKRGCGARDFPWELRRSEPSGGSQRPPKYYESITGGEGRR